MKPNLCICPAIAAFIVISLISQAEATVPFTENFTPSVFNWADGTGLNLATFVTSGGPDGSSYASSTSGTSGVKDGTGVVIFRGQDEFNSSGHAFEGNWFAGGINHFSAYIRSNAPVPVTIFARFATASNFPGVAADNGTIAQPNTWTLLSFDINFSAINATLFSEGPPSFYDEVFTNLGHVQIGYDVPAGYGMTNNTFTFGLDKVSISTPEPSGCVLAFGFASPGFIRRRSRTA